MKIKTVATYALPIIALIVAILSLAYQINYRENPDETTSRAGFLYLPGIETVTYEEDLFDLSTLTPNNDDQKIIGDLMFDNGWYDPKEYKLYEVGDHWVLYRPPHQSREFSWAARYRVTPWMPDDPK